MIKISSWRQFWLCCFLESDMVLSPGSWFLGLYRFESRLTAESRVQPTHCNSGSCKSHSDAKSVNIFSSTWHQNSFTNSRTNFYWHVMSYSYYILPSYTWAAGFRPHFWGLSAAPQFAPFFFPGRFQGKHFMAQLLAHRMAQFWW